MSMNGQADSVFFTAVPGEIRENIYSFYVAFDNADFHYSRLPSNTFLGKELFSRPLPALMMTCKRAYREMQDAVQEQAVLRAHRAGDRKRLGFAVHGKLRIPRLRRLVFQVMMEDANWGWWLRFFGCVMKMAGELRELVVDWRLHKGQRPWNGGQSVAPSKQFMARLEEKAEARLFETIAIGSATGKLQTVTIHGDVSAHWCEQLQRILGERVRVVVTETRWTVADGYGALSSPGWNARRTAVRLREQSQSISRLTPMPQI